MPFILEAACLCNTGKVRKNNEDNFFLIIVVWKRKTVG